MPTRREQKTSAASPLREALAAKTSLRTHFDIAVAGTEEIETATRRLNAMRQMEAATLLSDDDDVRAKGAQAAEDAQQARDALFHRIWFRGLPYEEFDALVALHPPTDEQAKASAVWGDTFELALFAEAAEDSDLTAEEWETELSTWTQAERSQAIRAALEAQRQTLAHFIPKD